MDPNIVHEKLRSAIEFHTQGNFTEAERVYQEVLIESPDHPDGLHLYGVLFLQQGKPEKAIELLRSAIDAAPEFADYHLNLGGAHFALKQWNEALTAYTRSVELDPAIFQAWKGIGACESLKENWLSAIDAFQKSLELNPDQLQVVFDLADAFTQTDKLQDAIQTMQLGLRIDENSEELHRRLATLFETGGNNQNAGMAWYNVGIIRQRNDDFDGAITALQGSLDLYADHPKARYSLDSLTGRTPNTAPPEYVQDLFNAYAGHFDDHLKGLAYEIPEKLYRLITSLPELPASHDHLLDLGCGTGQCGALFNKHCKTTTGIDMAPKMIAVCKERGVYERAECAELHQFLNADEITYDLILAADLFIYVGQLDEAFKLIAEATAPNGLFGFSVESIPGDSFALRDSGRFAHSEDYIKKLAAMNTFEILASEDTGIRIHKGAFVPGMMFVLRYSSTT